MSRNRRDNFGFLTPDEAPDDLLCRSFSIPNDSRWLGNFMGALLDLCESENWRAYGTLSPDEAAAAYQAIFDAGYAGETVCEVGEIGTPYWDTDADVNASEPADEQTWYGEVTNPDAPADELDFVENAIVWTFTGLLALASAEIAFAPAILFHTLAPRFIIAMRTADVAEVFRIVVNGQDYARVDTTGHASGEIINQTIVIDEPTDDNVLLILTELA